MYLLYSAALGLGLALGSPWWAWQMLRARKYRAGLGERLGRVPGRLGRAEGAVWVHAVSVGEVLAISAVLARLRQALPGRRIVISTTTLAGQELARRRFGEENVFYFPLDFGFALRPYFRALRPSLLVLAETEFWPNFLRLAKRFGARVAVVNARISDRSLPRYRRLRTLFAPLLRPVDAFLAQSEQDVVRLIEIGAEPARVSLGGNLKFDVQPPRDAALVGQLREALPAGGFVVVAGSTAAGEEELVLRAFAEVLAADPKAALVLAPRHPERFAAVAGLLDASGLRWSRRSAWQPGTPLAGTVLLLDSIGELAAVYQIASVAFVGGSLVAVGGHNVVEPARFGVPVVVGPHTANFRDMVAIFRRAGALIETAPAGLGAVLCRLLVDGSKRAELARRAAAVVAQQAGATERTLAVLERLIAAAPASGEAARATHPQPVPHP